jgi:hypothetical protein
MPFLSRLTIYHHSIGLPLTVTLDVDIWARISTFFNVCKVLLSFPSIEQPIRSIGGIECNVTDNVRRRDPERGSQMYTTSQAEVDVNNEPLLKE